MLNITLLIWPLLALGLFFTLLYIPTSRRFAHYALVYGRRRLLIFLLASILEELIFRWLLFYGAALLIPLVNVISFGLLKWFYSTVLGPLADFLTLHQLHVYLSGTQYSWVVGLALISSNGSFRDGHKYQGRLGWAWAWFCGMVLFLVMFRYGLFAAMFVHCCYNLFIWLLNWLIARLQMTPEEAQTLLQREQAEQQAQLASFSIGSRIVDTM
ncbi:hypothetical protein KDAU_43180 [Dictyobacter aurantiacus]|uniref:Abortive infection protein n=1 Tax=Dictyobacter aurantiacus TaxID=1936993 RepID=A0A401ZJH0_9CHLR|nr:hypothetical protein KDAU_43180 [Dictyobacter aurantiacus]